MSWKTSAMLAQLPYLNVLFNPAATVPSTAVAVDPTGKALALVNDSDPNATDPLLAYGVSAGGTDPAVSIVTGPVAVSVEKVVADASGNAFAVWQQRSGGTTSFYASRAPSGGAWAAPVSLAGSTLSGNPAIAVGAAGDAAAAWLESTSGSNQIWVQRYQSGGGWQAAEPVGPLQNISSGPVVAVDSSGNVTAVAVGWNGSTWRVLAYRWTAGAGWSAGTTIDGGGTNPSAPTIGSNATGTAVVAWVSNSGAKTLMANRFEPGSGWGTPSTIGSAVYNVQYPVAVVDAGGAATAMWSNALAPVPNRPYASRQAPGQAWSAPVDLATDANTTIGKFALALDGLGVPTAAWRDGATTASGIWATRFVSGAWSAPTRLDDGAAVSPVYSLSLGAGPAGQVAACWSAAVGGNAQYWIARFD
jgi:hypothetical protein